MYTRREFAKLSLAALPAASLAWKAVAKGRVSSNIGGVQIGVETYSYRSLRDFKAPPLTPAGQRQLVDKIAENIAQDGINYCEFWIAFVEPFAVPFNYGNAGTASPDPAMQKAREELQKWRTSSPHDIFEYARKKFEYSGIKIYSAMFNFTDSCTDDELDAAFGMAKALGTDILSANSTMAAAKRAAPLAEKHNIRVGLHSERELGTAENLREAMKLSPNMCVTLDIGHFTAANGDSVKFLTENHSRIVNLHIKDRYRNDAAPNGNPNDVKWGAGDPPIKPVLAATPEDIVAIRSRANELGEIRGRVRTPRLPNVQSHEYSELRTSKEGDKCIYRYHGSVAGCGAKLPQDHGDKWIVHAEGRSVRIAASVPVLVMRNQ